MEKIKQFINNNLQSNKGKSFLAILIIILASLSSFQLGRVSKGNSGQELKITQTTPLTTISPVENMDITTDSENLKNYQNLGKKEGTSIMSNNVKKSFFASKRGHKYYSVGCSAGKTIKQENRIYFASKEEAQKAGYSLSKSCK